MSTIPNSYSIHPDCRSLSSAIAMLCIVSTTAFPDPLHGHLPSPGVLLLLSLARIIRPKRQVTAHWNCFQTQALT